MIREKTISVTSREASVFSQYFSFEDFYTRQEEVKRARFVKLTTDDGTRIVQTGDIAVTTAVFR